MGPDGRFGARGGEPIDFWTLEQAAAELGASLQGVVGLLAERGIAIRRIPHGGRTLSGISRAELEVLRAALAPEEEVAGDTDLAQRLRETQRELEEARLDEEVAREACQQLARVTAEAEATGRRAAELIARLRRLEAELASAAERIAAGDARAGELEQELAREREARSLAEGRQVELERELAAAGELEAASGRFVDQLEQKLAAANATIARLRRRPA
jgi:chromosome segregation ATPase